MRQAVLGIIAAGALTIVSGRPAAQAQTPIIGSVSPGSDFFRHAVRIDGRQVTTSVQLIAELPPQPGDGSQNLIAPSPNVIMDAWTRRTATGPTGEDYDFLTTDDVEFTMLVKIGEPGAGGVLGIAFDYFLFPCGTSAIPPVPAALLFVDDVVFMPVGPGAVRLFTFTIRLTAATIASAFSAGDCADWFVAGDFDATNNPDLDADMIPDCCIELMPARLIDLGTSTVDEIGAGVIRFFNPGAGALDVFEPHPPNPLSKAAGAKPGEDGETRPWCFNLR